MGLATKTQILECQDWEFTDIEVEKWGTVRIRALTAKERLDLVKQVSGHDLSNDEAFAFYVKLLVMSIIDADGQQVFTDEDIPALQNKTWPKLERVAQEIMQFNGMGGDADSEKN